MKRDGGPGVKITAKTASKLEVFPESGLARRPPGPSGRVGKPQELLHMEVEDLRTLIGREVEAVLVDHLDRHGQPLPPAVLADVRLDLLSQSVLEGRFLQARVRLAAAAA